MATIFTRIINGDIPCYKIAEDDNFFAFLDINPLKAGHTLVVPKRETDYLFDLEDDDLTGIMLFSKKVAAAIRIAYPCNRIGVAVLGLEVPHAHIHLIPMDSMEDVNFKNPKLKFTPEEFREIAANISKYVIL
ncbi:MAG: HIT family hydrolase [Bacteroidetes bacterium GWE2_41_25]|nr:MAG: HIT family hydrolase [Bacteroidetes bacterium GWA2_40_15]OFX90066.1 MAG: HIT family hydrolase [Bacteroidetes bacterium GWC2_40_22]OFX95073.1 MAG: HIT family hydrolase [Bacteroidetes bacterium GWE2_41_25]OFY58054.1 MAG: HIT family hydrolase [Bacteroidetes bacterium GWF2_41_9]HAM11609.1 HIT family protein [Bacteroidales bacterium]